MPGDLAAQRFLEVVDGLHRHRVDELLVKLGIALARRVAVLDGEFLVRKIDRIVPAPARRIVVDDLDVFAGRAGLQRLEWDVVGDFVDAGGVESGGKTRIERVPTQGTERRPHHALILVVFFQRCKPPRSTGAVSPRGATALK